MTKKQRALGYRPGIDGLRAIAVLGVVLYHADLGPRAGFVGVDIFFVISGFLITSLLGDELEATHRIDLAAFYARRVRRLMPALCIMLTVTIPACFVILSPYGELTSALQSAAASLVFAANVFFQMTTGDYFGPNIAHLPLLHLWSLGVEEQYYLLWPIGLLAFRKSPLAIRRTVFAICAIASFAFAEWMISRGSQAAFYSMPSRWWELSLGALAAWAPATDERWGRWQGWGGTALVILAMALPSRHFPGAGALPATLGAALLMHASSLKGGAWRVLGSRPLVFVGRVSYPFYLWHWPLLALTSAAYPGGVAAPLRACLIVVGFVLAVCTWRWIELPARRLKLVRPMQLLAATLVATMATSLVIVEARDAFAPDPPPTDPAIIAERDMPANRFDCHARGDQEPALPNLANCTLGGRDAPRIAIWGDSHALAFQPFAVALAARFSTTAIGFTRDACAPIIGYENGKSPKEASRCRTFNAIVLPKVEAMDTVILAARWPSPLQNAFSDDLTATVDQLAQRVRRVFIIGATPDMPASVPDCIRRSALNSCEQPRTIFVARSAAVRQLLQLQATRHPNVTYVEPIDFFCNDLTCPGVRENVALYWDDNHISSTAAAAFATGFLRKEMESSNDSTSRPK